MKLRNKYYILRHGEALSNVRQVVSSWPEKFKNPLTKKGVAMIKVSAKKLKAKKIDVIFSSDLLRTRQTAEIVGKVLKLVPKFDKRLREVGFGAINSRPAEELFYLGFEKERQAHSQKRSETYESVLKRVYGFLKDIDKKYQGKQIVIVSHQCPLWILEDKVMGLSLAQGIKKNPKETRIGRGEIRELK